MFPFQFCHAFTHPLKQRPYTQLLVCCCRLDITACFNAGPLPSLDHEPPSVLVIAVSADCTTLTCRPSPVPTAAMFDSMLDSMSTSTIDMAKECLGQDPAGRGTAANSSAAAASSSETLDGIEALASAIDSGMAPGRPTANWREIYLR